METSAPGKRFRDVTLITPDAISTPRARTIPATPTAPASAPAPCRNTLENTGAGKAQVSGAIEDVIEKWLKRNQRQSISLIVAHRQLEDLHNPHIAVALASLTLTGTAQFYAIENWPQSTGHIDSGDRVIDVVPPPGTSRKAVRHISIIRLKLRIRSRSTRSN